MKRKKPVFNSVDEAIAYYTRKKYQKRLTNLAQQRIRNLEFQRRLQKAPVSTSVQQVSFAQRQAQARQRFMNSNASRSEQIELWAVSLNEVPMLMRHERERMFLTNPETSNFHSIVRQAERICTPSVKMQKLQEAFDLKGLPD